jgi:hypothetical protein
VYPATGGVGAQIFFNVGSMVAFAPQVNLDITVNVEFVDVPIRVEDPGNPGTFINSLAPDIFIDARPAGDSWQTYYETATRNRQLSGFFVDPLVPITSLDTGPARWRIGIGGNLMTHPDVQPLPVFADLPGSANQGFYVNDPTTNPRASWEAWDLDTDDLIYYEQLEAEWTFEEPPVPTPGIKWQLARDNLFHVATQFVAVDAAANETGDDDIDNILDPLHIWWLINVQTRILNNAEGRTLRSPDIDWALNRSTNVALTPPDDLTAGPRVISTFRVWAAERYSDVYVPITGWQPWSRRLIDSASLTEDPYNPAGTGLADLYPVLDIEEYLGPAPPVGHGIGIPLDLYRDRWLLIVVLSADEAGNVEPWPAELSLDAFDNATVNASNGVNWMRFYNGGEGLPDTQIEAEFWYDAAVDGVRAAGADYLGAVRRIPLRDQEGLFIEGAFTLVVDPGTAVASDIKVQWTLTEDGAPLSGPAGVSPWNPRRQQVVLPNDGGFASFRIRFAPPLPDPAADDPKHYTFEAMAFVDGNNNDIYEPALNEIADPVPATYSFTVLPAAPAFERVDTEDTQAIKIQEEQ